MKLSIKTNFPRIDFQLRELQKDVADAALVSAINKTLDQGNTRMVREITSEFALSQSYVRQRLKIRRAQRKGNQVQLTGALVGGLDEKRSANIIVFVEKSVTLAQAKRRAKNGTLGQLYVKVKRKGAKKPLPGAFIGNKGRTVFRRVEGSVMASRSKSKGAKHRQSIEPVQVIGIPSMFNTKRVNQAVQRHMLERFPINFEREVRFYLLKFNGVLSGKR